MSIPSHEFIDQLVLQLADQTPESRDAMLDELCGNGHDTAVREQITRRLHAIDAQSGEDLHELPMSAGSLVSGCRPTDRLIGQKIGRFRVLELLAVGGMGRVYLVTWDSDLNARYALKLANGETSLSRDCVLNEARMLSIAGAHPDIPILIDHGEHEGAPYVVMEYISGRHIDRYCNDEKLTIEQRLRLMTRVCASVGFVHERGVIHGDIKPANILVTDDGTPKLVDFGIACPVDGHVRHLEGNPDRGRTFTRHYASPEQLNGGTLTRASDVYSLGVVTYELVTGARPLLLPTETARSDVTGHGDYVPIRRCFDKMSAGELRSQADRCSTSPTGLHRETSADLHEVVWKSLRLTPDGQQTSVTYESADEFREDLQRVIDNRRPATAPTGSIRSLQRFMRRSRPWLAPYALIAVLASLVVGMVLQSLIKRVDPLPVAYRHGSMLSVHLVADGDSADGRIVMAGPDATILTVQSGESVSRIDISAVDDVNVYGTRGHDTFEVDFRNGDPLPPGGLTFYGTDGTDQIRVRCNEFDSRIQFLIPEDADTITIQCDSSMIRLASVESIDLDGGGGDDVIDASRIEPGFVELRLAGGDGNDVIRGCGGDDVLSGGPGDDEIFGGAGSDTLAGDDGVDVLHGGDGADRLDGGQGNDEVFGELGDADVLVVSGGTDLLDGGPGDHDRLLSALSGTQILTDTGLDHRGGRAVLVSIEVVELHGSIGPDRIDVSAYSRPAAIYGEAGDDTLMGPCMAGELHGGAGNDRLSGGSGKDLLVGGRGSDHLVGGPGDDLLYGDFEETRSSAESETPPYMHYTALDFRIEGDTFVLDTDGPDDDVLTGGTGADLLVGGPGFDVLNEQCDGSLRLTDSSLREYTGDTTDAPVESENSLVSIEGIHIVGSHDANTIDCRFFSGPVRMYGNEGDDVLIGGRGDDGLQGDGGSDRLFGHEGDDRLAGSSGPDLLDGGPGDDTVLGQGGSRDTLVGGTGSDVLDGGVGADKLLIDDGDGLILTDTTMTAGPDTDQLTSLEKVVIGADRRDIRSDVSGFSGTVFLNLESGEFVEFTGHR